MASVIAACGLVALAVWWGTNAVHYRDGLFFRTMFQAHDPGAQDAAESPGRWWQWLLGSVGRSSAPAGKTQRSVADAGQIHLLYVTHAGTDARMGLTSKLFITREAPNALTAKLMTEVGKDMKISFDEGLRYVEKLPRAWEKDFSLRLSFEDKFTSKDGGSAGTGFTVAMLAAIQGVALDPEVAVTGDLTVDGTVQPVGAVIEKLRGSIVGKCKITMIPERNSREVTDMALLDGTSPLWETQIFSISTVDQALAIARQDRAEKLRNAIARFKALRSRLPATVTPEYLQSPVVKTELEQVLRDAPNHLSAATLLRAAANQLPRELSLNRSVDEILVACHLFVGSVINPEQMPRTDSNGKGFTLFPEREYTECMKTLQRLTPILDRRSIELKSNCATFSAALRAVWTYQSPDMNANSLQRLSAEGVRRERRIQDQVREELEDARSRLLLSIRKLDTDGSLMLELLKR